MLSDSTGHLLLLATGTASVLALISFWMLAYAGRYKRKSPYWYPLVWWVGHAAVFYLSNVVMRLFFDYARPTVFFSSWGLALYIQAFISIIGVTAVKLRMER